MRIVRILTLSFCFLLPCYAQNYRRMFNTTSRAFLRTDIGKNVETVLEKRLKIIERQLPQVELLPEVVAASSLTYYTISKKRVELNKLVPVNINTSGVDISPNIVYSWRKGHDVRANIRLKFKIEGFTY